MTDIALQQLLACMAENRGEGLWVVDENLQPDLVPDAGAGRTIGLISNRVDVVEALADKGYSAQLSDFDFSAIAPQSLDCAYYRVSKEKPVVHWVLNQLAERIKPGGTLFLAGYKNEGTKTYFDKARERFAGVAEKKLLGKTAMLCHITRGEQLGPALDDKAYNEMRPLAQEPSPQLLTKPGVYGWQKQDKGSQLLIDCLPEVLSRMQANNKAIDRLLDLGCGYGFISVEAAKLTDAYIVATDNNVAAVDVCRANFEQLQIHGEVLADDCGQKLATGFDLILCNPPFHQGFDVSSELSEKFIRQAARLLKPGGYVLWVVNAFLGVEAHYRAYFSNQQQLLNNKQFKVILCEK